MNSVPASGSRSTTAKINAKSLLGVLSMAITTGTEVTLIAEGPRRGSGSQDADAQMLVKDIF